MFVPEERMMSSDGKVLKQLQRAVCRAIEESPHLERALDKLK